MKMIYGNSGTYLGQFLRFLSFVPSLSFTCQRPRKNQGRTKEKPKNKKCFLLRLQFLLSLLYCTQQHRPMSERRARERPKNTSTSKVHFLNIAILKRLTHFLTQLTPFLKQLSSCISFAFLRTLSMPLCLLAAGAPITLTCGVMVC